MSNQRTIDAFYAAYAGWDVAAMAGLMHEDVRHRVYAATNGASPFSGEFVGIAAVAAHLRQVYATWRIDRLDANNLVVEGGRAAATVTVEATARSGARRIRTTSMHFVTLRDERVAEFDIFFSEMRTQRLEPRQLEPNDDR